MLPKICVKYRVQLSISFELCNQNLCNSLHKILLQCKKWKGLPLSY